jgi:23S rRNA pseudouridine1911/1915/1917 synthase
VAHLSKQFAERTVEKRYLAIVSLPVDPETGQCEHRIKRDPRKNKSFVSEKGKLARLYYRVVCEGDRYAMLEVALVTGRHHQIRAQLAAVGHPIRGDLKYGAPRSQRGGGIALHAVSLRCVDPASQEEVFLVAPPPDDRLWNDLYASYQPGADWPAIDR